MNKRHFLLLSSALVLASGLPATATQKVWSTTQVAAALAKDDISLIDVRSREEWIETGLAKGAWPISMHEDRFEERLFKAGKLSGERSLALICATGGRSGLILAALTRAGFSGFIDVSEGMLGSRTGPGWIARGLPTTELPMALANLPASLR